MPENILNQYITKIEGHGKLSYSSKAGLVRVEIDEGERLFEKLVVGKSYKDVSFITARICGVCPTAHTFAAIDAVENAFGVNLNDSIISLRRALVAAQIVQSHVLHLYFLALPDYLNAKSGLELYDKNPRVFKLASELKGLADGIIEVIGGRAVHPVSPAVGGFHSVPDSKKIEELIAKIRHSYRLAQETVDLFAGFRYPYLDRKTTYFSVTEDGLIDILGNTIIGSDGTETAIANYQYVISEKVKPYSTAKFAEHKGKGFMVGAIARVNMMEEGDFNPKTQEIIKDLKIKLPILNSFKNNLAQAIEVLNYLEEIEKSLTAYLWGKKERFSVGYRVRAGIGVGAIEAPRGTLYHMYEFDKKGIVKDCDIVTPTVQNLTNLEDDANTYLKQNKSVTIPRRERELEMLVRAYDPCITCSVH
jgi:coenzyme F420-reducing hydrogenase alpha subunit